MSFFDKLLFSVTILSIMAAGCTGSHSTSTRDQKYEEIFIPKQNPKYGIVDSFYVINAESPMTPTPENLGARFEELKEKQYFDISDIDTPVVVKASKISPPVIGDLNGDQIPDALYPYEILGGSKEDSFYLFYLVLLNNGEYLVPVEHFYAGCREAELYTRFESISDSGLVKGHQVPGIYNKYPDKFPIQYIFDGKELVAP